MPTHRGFSCSLMCSNLATREAKSLCKEHGMVISHNEAEASCYAEVTTGNLEVVLTPVDKELDHVLVRIEIDGKPRVQRLVPLNHPGASQLLRFNATEYCGDTTWYSHRWKLQRILPCTMLRTSRGPYSNDYGVIAVSVFRIGDVVRLEGDARNYEIWSWVKDWRKELMSPAIPAEDYQDRLLTQVVVHRGKTPEVMKRETHKAELFSVLNALRHDWKFVDEAVDDTQEEEDSDVLAKPMVKFIFNYREKDKITTTSLSHLSQQPHRKERGPQSRKASALSQAGRKSTLTQHSREQSPFRSDSPSKFGCLTTNYNYSTSLLEMKIKTMERQLREMKAEEADKRRRIHEPGLEAQISQLKKRHENAQAVRLTKLNEMDEMAMRLSEEVKSLIEQIYGLKQDHDRDTANEKSELESLELRAGEHIGHSSTVASSKERPAATNPTMGIHAGSMKVATSFPRSSVPFSELRTKSGQASTKIATPNLKEHGGSAPRRSTLVNARPMSSPVEMPAISNMLSQGLPWQTCNSRRCSTFKHVLTSTEKSGSVGDHIVDTSQDSMLMEGDDDIITDEDEL